MSEKVLYEGPNGLEHIKAHMRVAFIERQRGSGQGWSQDYFRGWLHGLATADAISSDISLAAHAFVNERGYQ